MKRNFVIPAAVALGFHAALLIGFHSVPAPAIGDHSQGPARPKPPPEDTVLLPVADPANEADEPSASPPAPSSPPDLAEPQRESVDHCFIEIPELPRVPVSGPANGPLAPITPGDGFGGLHGISTGPFSARMLDNSPRTRSQVAPIYPYEARVAGRTGEVLVEFVVNESGHVLDPHVLRASDPIFEKPTLQAVAKWRFEPGRKDGRVVRFRMTVPVAFAVNS